MNRCQFILGASGEPNRAPSYEFCDAPASIKREGIWLCAEHYDEVEDGKPVNYVSKDPNWLPAKLPDVLS